MAKFKTRLQYNSMGERVAVRVEVGSIDAFSARARQRSSPCQEGPNSSLDNEDKGNGVADGGDRSKNNGGDGGASSFEGLSVSKSLGFGWPDFSSVGSKVSVGPVAPLVHVLSAPIPRLL